MKNTTSIRARAVRSRGGIRAGLDPSCYKTLSEFRRAVANGSVDVSKACRSMREYRRSLSHA